LLIDGYKLVFATNYAQKLDPAPHLSEGTIILNFPVVVFKCLLLIITPAGHLVDSLMP